MAAFYENSPWISSSARQQPAWEPPAQPQPQPHAQASSQAPSRSGNSSVNRVKPIPFYHQIEEVERAIENLRTSTKSYPIAPGRRDSVPVMPRRAFGPEYNGMVPPRPYSLAEFDPAALANVAAVPVTPEQLYVAQQQRFMPRPIDNDQAKRRAAAARERELRNYHQEQQYSRNTVGSSTPRSRSNSGSSNTGLRSSTASTVPNTRTSTSSPSDSPSRIGNSSSAGKSQNLNAAATMKASFNSRLPPAATGPASKNSSTPGVPSPLGFGFSNSGSSTPGERGPGSVGVRPSPGGNQWSSAGNVWSSAGTGMKPAGGAGAAKPAGFAPQSSVWN